MSSSIRMTWVLTILSGLSLLYFVGNQASYSPTSEEAIKVGRMRDQVAFRDPKLIEEHKKYLEEMNQKNKK